MCLKQQKRTGSLKENQTSSNIIFRKLPRFRVAIFQAWKLSCANCLQAGEVILGSLLSLGFASIDVVDNRFWGDTTRNYCWKLRKVIESWFVIMMWWLQMNFQWNKSIGKYWSKQNTLRPNRFLSKSFADILAIAETPTAPSWYLERLAGVQSICLRLVANNHA